MGLEGRLQGPAMATMMLEGRDRQRPGGSQMEDARISKEATCRGEGRRLPIPQSLMACVTWMRGGLGQKKDLGSMPEVTGGMGIQGSEVTPSPTQLQVALLCP